MADIDGDGKADLITNNGKTNNYISVYLNKSTPGNIQFLQNENIFNYKATAIAVSDLNGDGKPDLIAYDNAFNKIHFYTNKSTPGNINFIEKTDIYINGIPTDIAIGDLDNDGKPEIAFANSLTSQVDIYRNTTINGELTFNTQKTSIAFGTNIAPQTIVMGDIDQDGKNELIIDFNLKYFIAIYKNTSVAQGSISFAPAINLATPYAPNGIAIGDLDMDGKPDIFTPASYANVLSVFKNTSPSGSISVATRVDYSTGDVPRSVSLTDVDGDGLADVIVGNVSSSTISVYKNTSTLNNLSLANKVDYVDGGKPYALAVGDIDGDGKPDISSVTDVNYKTIILRNRQGESILQYFCPPTASSSITATETGLSYQWQLDSGSGFSNISNNTYYTGATTANLQIANAPSAWYGYKYRCLVDSKPSDDVSELRFRTTWLGTQNANWEEPLNWSCSAVPDINTDVTLDKKKPCNINTNVSVRSLNITSQQLLQVLPTASLLIAH